MKRIWRVLERIRVDIFIHKINIETYVVSGLALALAIVNLIPDIVPDDFLISVGLAALGLLVFNLTVPETQTSIDIDTILQDRTGYSTKTLGERIEIENRRHIWMYGVTGGNVLNNETLDTIKHQILDQGGTFRLLIQDPSRKDVIRNLIEHLDDRKGAYANITMDEAMKRGLQAIRNLHHYANTRPGTFEYGFLSISPGLSLVVLDPEIRGAEGNVINRVDDHLRVVIPEFYGFHNLNDSDRMHVEITKAQSPIWYDYWLEQFEKMWEMRSVPDEPLNPDDYVPAKKP